MSSRKDFQELWFSDDRKKQDVSKYNVRKSLDWDDAFFTSPGILEPQDLFRFNKSGFRDDILGVDEEILLPSWSFEPELSSTVDDSNLRKSLAWDNAFFSNAGLLDPEELSLVNKGFKNYDTPGIEQDVLRSTESNYSLDSGTSSLTSLEMDLNLQSEKASKKLEASSQTRMKNTPPFRRLTIDSHATKRCTKKASRSVPSRKQLFSGRGELNSSSYHKPPKSLNRGKQTAKVSTKRASSVANSLKVGTPKAASGECLTIPKKPSLGNLLSFTNSSTLPAKPSTSGFPTAAAELVSCSPNNSGSAFRTPLRCTLKDKSKRESSSRPGIMLSTPMSSSCTSSGSSLYGWSSESRLTSVIQRSSNLRESQRTPSRHVSSENTASQESALKSHLHNPSSTGSLPSSISKNSKPSGVRMQSPKIGFFNTENSSLPTTEGCTQYHSGLPNTMSKVGSGNRNGPANQTKHGKPPVSRTLTGTRKHNGSQSVLQITPTRATQEVQNPAQDGPAAKGICFPMNSKAENDLDQKTSCKDCLGPEKVQSKEGHMEIVRKSFTWDDAFFTSPGIFEPEELFRFNKSGFRDDILGLDEEILLPSWSFEPELSSTVDNSNLRKSLTWDNAFFSNAGLLNPEELSLVNKGFKNYDTHLPGIERDVSRSTESNYSLDSGTSSLTSLEMDLFEDMRASRPNSVNTPSSSSSLNLQREKASKKLEASSQTRLSAGRGELNSSSSHKPLKSLNRVKQTAKVSTKRTSSVANSLKLRNPKAASGECLTNPKKPSLGFTNSSSQPAKPSTSGFPTAAAEFVSLSLNNSGSAFRTPLRCTPKEKSKQESSSHPGIMLSTPMSSSCTSPSSSLYGWSSELRSISVIQRSSNLRESLGTPCRHVSSENTASPESALQNQSGTGSLPSSISKNSKPSGLRMPSPKIGFFDKEKSSLPTAKGCTQYHSGLQNAMSKVGNSNCNGSANQTKHGKPPVSTTLTGTRKHKGSQSVLQITPAGATQVEEVQNPAQDGLATKGICFPMNSKAENDLDQKTSFKDCLGPEKVQSKEGQMEIVLQRAIQNTLKEYEQHLHFPGNEENIYTLNKMISSITITVLSVISQSRLCLQAHYVK